LDKKNLSHRAVGLRISLTAGHGEHRGYLCLLRQLVKYKWNWMKSKYTTNIIKLEFNEVEIT